MPSLARPEGTVGDLEGVVEAEAMADEERDYAPPPLCDLRAAVAPVRGQLTERRTSGGRTWEFALEAGCMYRLWEPHATAHCLQGSWVVIAGASQSNIWMAQLANSLVPGAIQTQQDHFNMDGVFTLAMDVILLDGAVVYKKVLVDNQGRGAGDRIGAHTKERDRRVMREAFAEVARGGIAYSSRAIRITNFLSEWWDNVDLAMEAVESAGGWAEAKVALVTAVGMWYATALSCNPRPITATRPAYCGLPLDGLVQQYLQDFSLVLPRLEAWCSKGGRAGKLGCAVTTSHRCKGMEGDVWARIHSALRNNMLQRATPLFRFVDLWTLSMQMPEECLDGHPSPMTAIWALQVLLGGMCPARPAPAADAAAYSLAGDLAPQLARFRGPTCTAAQAQQVCKDLGVRGFQFIWECALAEPCTLDAVPAASRPRLSPGNSGVVDVDFAAAESWARVNSMRDRHLGTHPVLQWLLALTLVVVAAYVLRRHRKAAHAARGDSGASAAAGLRSAKYAPLPSPASPLDDERGEAAPRLLQDDRQKQALRAPSAAAAAAGADPAERGEGRFPFGAARCLAALHVALGHLYARQAVHGCYFFSWGFTWVPWFFMLSGFVLHSAQARRPAAEPVLDFLSRRVAGVYPLYAAAVLLAAVVAKLRGALPSLSVLLLQAWLGQAWIPTATERALQAQCWFLSCLLGYWLFFGGIAPHVSRLSTLPGVLAVAGALMALPWITVSLVAALSGDDLPWFEEHVFGRVDGAADVAVVTLKFHPLCYFHVFLLGMVLAQLRIQFEPHAHRAPVRQVLQVLAPLGYAGLALVFCVPALRPFGATLSARLGVLLPLQAAVLLGLAGVAGAPAPPLAAALARLQPLERYAYPAYLLQFTAWDLWPAKEAGPPFFACLAAASVLLVHGLQLPTAPLWQRHPRAIWALPMGVSAALTLAWLLPSSIRASPGVNLPAFLRLEDLVVDVRLPLEDDSAGGGYLINPSVLFRGGGVDAVVAARRHRRTSRRSAGTFRGEEATIIEEVWHSEILVGTFAADPAAWTQWLSGGEPVSMRSLAEWDGLRTASGQPWAQLCVRERWMPENSTLMRLVVTGPEDPKVFQLFPELGAPAVDVAFSSYPPRGRHGCGQDGAVPQMYLARGVDPRDGGGATYGVRLDCGHRGRPEKNWIPFQSGGKLHFVYSLLPHVVVQVEEDGRCGEHHYSNFAPLVRLQALRPELAIRGSAQALLVRDPAATPTLRRPHYLALFHVVEGTTGRYAHFAYRFSHEAPFEILQVSTQLPLQVAPADGGGDGPSFAFASGLALRESEVVITYAAGDRDPRALILPLQRLDLLFAASMRDSQPQGGSL